MKKVEVMKTHVKGTGIFFAEEDLLNQKEGLWVEMGFT